MVLIAIAVNLTAFAESIPNIYIGDKETTETDITVSISVSENTGFCGGSMNIVYDNTLLQPKSFNTSELLNGFIANVNLNYAEDTIRFSWAGTDEIRSGGVLFDVTFEVVATENFETDIVLDKLKLADADGEKIEVTSEIGHIRYEKETSSSVTTGHHGGGNAVQNIKHDTETDENENQATDVEENDSKYVAFSDVKQTDWFYGYVKTVQEKGLMMGVSETDFAPNAKLTRAMFVTILYRMAGEPETTSSKFSDIEEEIWYERAVGWASANGIVTGISEAEFAPNTDITREQMAVIVFRYAKYTGLDTEAVTKDTTPLSHNDVFEVSDWAKEAMHYCIAAGIINGDENGNLLPHNTATRAETAAVITRLQ